MVQSAYLIVHNKEAFERHSNVLGLIVRVDKDGSYKPVSRYTDSIGREDTIVYYTLGDCLVRRHF